MQTNGFIAIHISAIGGKAEGQDWTQKTSHEVQKGGGRGQETAGKTKQIASLRSSK